MKLVEGLGLVSTKSTNNWLLSDAPTLALRCAAKLSVRSVTKFVDKEGLCLSAVAYVAMSNLKLELI